MSERFALDLALGHLGRDFPEIAWTTGVAILLFSPISIIGNGLVLASIFLDPFKNIRTSPSCGLIFSLALADLLAGVFAGPLMALWLINYGMHNSQLFSANILPFSGIVSVGVSLIILLALTIDRQIAITTPLQYAGYVTKKRIRNVNIFIWCSFIMYGTLSIVFDTVFSVFDIVAAAYFVVVSTILAVLNVVLIRSVHNQALKIKRTVDSENVAVLKNAFHREKAVTKTVCVMVAVFELCLWPLTITTVIVIAMRDVTDLDNIAIKLWVYFSSKTLVFANSLMNPFLYAWRLPKYSKTFQYFLIRLTRICCTSVEQHEVNTSLRLPATQDNQNTPASFSFPSPAHHNTAIGSASSTTAQTVCSSAFNNIRTGEDTCSIDGHDGAENTHL